MTDMTADSAAPVAVDAPTISHEHAAPAQQEAPKQEAPGIYDRSAMERDRNKAVDDAFDKVFAEPKANERSRDEAGRFVSANGEATPAPEQVTQAPETTPAPAKQAPATPAPSDAPGRFSADAKAAWATTPDPVKAEVQRAIGELETGLKGYKERYTALKPYDDLAKQHGTTVEAALQNYVNMETELKNDPESGLARIFNYLGINQQEWAAKLTGQPGAQQQAPSQRDPAMSEMEKTVADLRGQLQQLTGTITQREDAEALHQIETFKASNTRFEELRPDMALFLQNGRANTLQEAYDLAARLNPAPAPVSPPPQAAPDLKAQTLKGQLSTTGAPAGGSNPSLRKPPKSAGEAIDRAFAHFNLG